MSGQDVREKQLRDSVGSGSPSPSVVPELDPLRRGRVPRGAEPGAAWRSRSRAPSSGCRGTVGGLGEGRHYAILRVAKLKAMGNLHGAAQHHLRERYTPNADPDRLDENEILIGADTAQGIAEDWRAVAPAKFRKDAVRAVEYFVGASPEAMRAMSRDDQDAYLHRALAWIEDRHAPGSVISAVVHRDETTPHLSVIVVPVDPDTGNLNAKRWTGGRATLSAMQTDFAETVAPWGLERGAYRSTATHTKLQEYYAGLSRGIDLSKDAAAAAVAALPQRERAAGLGGTLGRMESAEDYAERVKDAAAEEIADLRRQLHAAQQANRALERQAERARRTSVKLERDARMAKTSASNVRVLINDLRETEFMDEGEEKQAAMRAIATETDRVHALGALDDTSRMTLARALHDWGEATPAMQHDIEAEDRRIEREAAREHARETGQDLEDDDGYGL
ncbi:MAG: MobV family relaxase [Shimia sp.]